MTNGRQKGAKAERDVAKLLSAWWSPFEPGTSWKRTPSSGGWASPDARASFKTAGDIVTDAKLFPFAVEVKCRVGWSWNTFTAGRASPVWGWWRQAQAQALEMGAEPMLWFRGWRELWKVLLREDYVDSLGSVSLLPMTMSGDGLRHLWGRAWGHIQADHGEHRPALFDADLVLRAAPSTFALPCARATPGRRRSTHAGGG